MKTPILKTERLTLRPVTLDDAPDIQKWFNNWEIIKNLSMGVPWPYPDDGAETFIRDKILPKTENGEMLAWGITINEAGDDKVIGFISYHFEPDELGDNRGFWMAQHCWGKGYMTEAVTAMQDYIFFDLDIDFFIVGNLRSNIASRRIKEKLGGEFLKLDQIEHRNGETDSEKWIIKKENWKKIRSKSA